MQRENWIDWAKSFAIYTVVLGHITTSDDPSLIRFITNIGYAFQLPLFFFISGYLYKNKNADFKDELKNNVKTLIVPYVFFNLASALILYKLLAHSVWHNGLKGFFMGESFAWSGPSWFLIALFMLKIVAYGLYKEANKKLTTIVILLSIFVSCVVDVHIPLGISSAIMAMPFFMLGVVCRNNEYFCKIKCMHPIIRIAVIICCAFVVTYLIQNKLIGINFARSKILSNEIMCYIGAFLSSLMIVLLSTLLNDIRFKFVIDISKGCITIMGLHLTILQCLWPFGGYLSDKYVFLLESPCVTPLVFILSFIVAKLLMSYTPYLVGNRK
jgi:fucose 4-O-acetylase-like acetyltransferase